MRKKEKILEHFAKSDSMLFSLMERTDFDLVKPRKPESYFESLCYEIIGQQLSGKIAKTIFDRFVNLFPEKKIDHGIIINMQ